MLVARSHCRPIPSAVGERITSRGWNNVPGSCLLLAVSSMLVESSVHPLLRAATSERVDAQMFHGLRLMAAVDLRRFLGEARTHLK